jgi:hypothetical protein
LAFPYGGAKVGESAGKSGTWGKLFSTHQRAPGNGQQVNVIAKSNSCLPIAYCLLHIAGCPYICTLLDLKNPCIMKKPLLSLLLIAYCLLPVVSSANNYPTPGTGVKWTLDQLVANSGGDVTFSGGAYNVNDTIFISLNDTLNITADAIVKFATGTYLDVNGVLIINPPTGVTFTAQNTANRYLGMRIDSSNGTRINKLTFEYANSLRVFDCSPLIENSIFRLNTQGTTFGNAAVSVFRSKVTINNCQFIDNQRAAIQGGANIANAPIITNCTFIGNNTTNQNVPQINLGASGVDTTRIIGNQILRASTNSGGIGFLPIGDVRAIIKGNVIRNNRYGITLNGGANINAIISYNQIDSNNTQGNPNLGGSGISFSGGSSTSHQNVIVTGNTFTANLWGITIVGNPIGTGSGAQPNLGNLTNTDTTDDGKNRFINNTNTNTPGIDLYNNSVDPIFAQGNYWNTNLQSGVESRIFHTPDNAVLGLVNYSNYIVTPALFLSFTAAPGTNGNSVVLNWGVVNETNSSVFAIERSFDGVNFGFINQVNAAGPGNTIAPRDYTYTDQPVNYFNAPIYYRLKLVNANGSFQYSQVVAVTLALNNNGGQLIRIFPTVINPTQVPTLEVTSPIQQFLSMVVFDAAGKRLKELRHGVIAGTTRSLLPLDLPVVAKGWIYVKIKAEGIDATIPLLIQ